MKRSPCRWWLWVVLSGAFFFWFLTGHVAAQSWSPPVKFFEVEAEGNVQSPTLVNDSGGNLHAFWGAAMTRGQPMALYYSRWQDGSWSEPIDVLLSPDGGNVWPFTLIVDPDDYVHIFWASGGQIWQSQAHASFLGVANAWERPRTIALDRVLFGNPSVAIDNAGVWYVVYGNRALDSIYLLKSEDEMTTWQPDRLVYQEVDPNTWVGYPRLVIAPDGVLWTSWEQMEAGSGRTKGVVFSRSLDGGQTWETPEQLIEGYYSGGFRVVGNIMLKTIVGGVGTGGRYVSFSYDNGKTWTTPHNISAGGGEGMQGIGLIVDSAGIWHFVVETGMTFARVSWNSDTWSPPDFIVPRDVLATCCVTPGKTTENASVGLSDGNRMHVIFEEDNRVLWYTSRELPAPFVASIPLPTPTKSIISTPTPSDVPMTTPSLGSPSRGVTTDLTWPERPSRQNLWWPLVAAIGSTLTVVGVIFLAVLNKQARR